MLAGLIALVIHEVRVELRKLDKAAATPAPGGDAPAYDPASTTACSAERAAAWDHDRRPPVTAASVGFTPRRPG